jgi:hypothetical protein
VGEGALTLGALLGQNVRLESVLTLHFASTGQLETLFGTRLGLYFGHGLWLIIDCLVLTLNDLRGRQRQPSTTGLSYSVAAVGAASLSLGALFSLGLSAEAAGLAAGLATTAALGAR